MSEPAAFVHLELDGVAHPVGRLWVSVGKGRESATFEYDATWLSAKERFALEPALTLGPGPFHTIGSRALFGALGDSAPDRWGRTLIARAERRRANAERRAPRALREIDYLLGVTDEVRQGALRFTLGERGPFVAQAVTPGEGTSVPPLMKLPKLLAAAEHVLDGDESDADLRLLLAPGSSLGGARPKASVRDRDGSLLIAKFPAKGDETNVVRWEALALSLASRAGIPIPEWRVERVAGRDVLLVRRFDRRDLGAPGETRVPFLSAMSMLGAADRETRSYLEIADALRMHGASVAVDVPALWRRIVFNVLISNTDDHLRNHAFLYVGPDGWRLSPAYDMNPVPPDVKPRILSTAIGQDGDPTASMDIAFEVAESFTLSARDARATAAEVGRAVANWRSEALAMGISPAEVDRMASAFDHADLNAAIAA